MLRAVDPFHEGLVAVFPQIRQFLFRLLDPLARPYRKAGSRVKTSSTAGAKWASGSQS